MHPNTDNLVTNGSFPTLRVILPPLFGLPIELWVKIFIHSFPVFPPTSVTPLTSSKSPLLVSQICRDWRNIALSTPSLWTQLRVEVSDRTSVSLIDLWLSRSASFPLYFSIVWYRDPPSTVSTSLSTLFASHINHLRFLEIHLHGKATSSPVIPPEGAPMLEKVFVFSHHEDEVLDRWLCSVMHAAPQLKFVSYPVSRFSTQLDLPWAQLSHLRITVYSLEQALDILASALELVECAFWLPSRPPQESIRRRPHILLPRLAVFFVDASNTEVVTPFFDHLIDHLTLPSLKGFAGIFWFDHSFLSLLSRSHTCSLSSLRITHALIPDTLLLECLKHPCMQSLSTLEIEECTGFTDRVLEFLTFRDGGVYSLPKLRTLNFFFPRTSLTSTDGLLADMIESRCLSQSLPTGIDPLIFAVIFLDRDAHPTDLLRLAAFPQVFADLL